MRPDTRCAAEAACLWPSADCARPRRADLGSRRALTRSGTTHPVKTDAILCVQLYDLSGLSISLEGDCRLIKVADLTYMWLMLYNVLFGVMKGTGTILALNNDLVHIMQQPLQTRR